MHRKRYQKKQVLIIDDEQSLSQMLSMLLETRGYQVRVASTGKQALQEVSPQIDLIILDLVLPDINGFEVCKRLKDGEHTRNIPIIILSASSYSEDKIEGLYLGADDYLSKPCEHEELFARMEAVMRRKGPRRRRQTDRHQDQIVFELRKIHDHALIVPHFQPVYQFYPQKLFGLEILSRPKSSTELANPETFFRAALEFGMYKEMELLSWKIALDMISDRIQDEKLFLNCNPYLIEAIGIHQLEKVFSQSSVKENNVILEITERSAITDFKLFYDRMSQYRNKGFQFAVDDVGGGYASLESIVEIRPEVVKIDRHIIRNLNRDSFKQSIVKFIVQLCRENGIFSVAEGIESYEDLQAVKDLGVNAGQGFYLYRPSSIVNFPELQDKII